MTSKKEYSVREKAALLFVFCSFLYLGSAGQEGRNKGGVSRNEDAERVDSIEFKIRQIREDYIRINSDSSKYKVIEKDIEGESSEGGLSKKFYCNDTLKKLVTIFYGEMGRLTSEYYFKNKELIFLFEKEERYNAPMYVNESKVVEINENRYYVNQGKLIRWIGKGGKVVTSKDYPAKEAEILRSLNDLISKL